jgi:hypothetical protein
VRKFVAVLAFLALAGISGCSDKAAKADGAPPPGPQQAAPKSPSPAPAAAEGGACLLVEFGTINKILGVDFTVAAASKHGDTFTCVAQGRGASFPDVTLSVTATDISDATFTATVKPKGAVAVAGLGRAGYSIGTAAKDDAGPGIDVGWLAGNARLLDLRLRLTPQATADQVSAALPKMVDLARQIDLQSI